MKQTYLFLRYALFQAQWDIMRSTKSQNLELFSKRASLLNGDLFFCQRDYAVGSYIQGRQENLWAPGQKETCPPSPILQIMILELSPPRCVISKESVQ
jgi:hypothetical protein